jgi:predicted RNase H-like HicB family nuclease
MTTVISTLTRGTLNGVTILHVPYTLGQDEDGIWFAHAWLGSSGGANGNGATPEEAVTDLREAVEMVIEEDGVPAQLAQTLDLEVA